MERDWKRLAVAIRQAREAANMTQIDLAERANISEGSVQNLESGNGRTRIPPTLARVERALGWAAGSGVAILQGAAEPVLISDVGGGRYVATIPESELQDAVTKSAIAVTDNLTAREIRDLAQRITDELKQRGLL